MNMKELLEKARYYNGMIQTPEDLLSHLERVQTCAGCGLDYYDKICPRCRDKFDNQQPEVNTCKVEKKCSKSVNKITEAVALGKVIRNSPVDTDALKNPELDSVSSNDGRRLNSVYKK